jgi:hypothetical protein
LRHECLPFDRVDFSSSLLVGQSNAKISDSVAKNNRVLELTFEPTDNLMDNVSGTIVLNTSVPGYERFTIHVAGAIKSPVQSFPSVVALDQENECSVTLVSLIDQPFEIVDIDCDSAITCQYDKTMKKEHQLHIRKSGTPESMSFIVRYRLDKEQTIIDYPLTLFLDNAF